MAKKKKSRKKKLVTKDAGYGIGVPVSNSPSSYQVGGTNTPQSNVVQTPPPQTASMYWPAPTRWYQEGKEATKKAILQYVNDANDLQSESEQERKIQIIGRMNNHVQYIIQGIAIATEAAELQSQRKRTGDQAAVFELAVTEDTLRRLLKILWIHNYVSKKAVYPGLEIKLLESQLTGRINRTTSLKTNDDGIEVELDKGEDPRLLWQVDYQPPAPGQQGPPEATTSAPAQAPAPPGATQPSPQPGETQAAQPVPPMASQPPSDQGAALPQQPSPEVTPTSAEAPPAQEAAVQGQQPPAPEQTAPQQTQEETMATQPQTQPQPQPAAQPQPAPQPPPAPPAAPAPQPQPTEQAPPQAPPPTDTLAQRELLLAQREAAVAAREAAVANREAALATSSYVDEERGEEPEEQEGVAPVENEETPVEADVPVENEETSPEPETGGEEPGEEGSEPEPPEEEEDDEDVRYCIECDRDVDEEDRTNCDNPRCPFKTAEESEEEREPEAPEGPVPEDEEELKHFVLMNVDDHENHRTQKITLKEYDGVTGEYCIDCQKLISYRFDDTWEPGQVKSFVDKQVKKRELVNKTPEELVLQSLDYLSDEEILAFIEEKADKTDNLDLGMLDELTDDELKDVVRKSVENSYQSLTTKVAKLSELAH